jgi:hypothetical protein
MSRQSYRTEMGRLGANATRRAEVDALTLALTPPPCDPASIAARELAEYERMMGARFDERIARGAAGIRTKHAHLYCAGSCGTRSKLRCGGRWWANRYSLSLVVKTDATHRIAVGDARAKRIKDRGW